jgi:Mannosyl-glycoprotein endo-beta-N-acetylglucosaminidase.
MSITGSVRRTLCFSAVFALVMTVAVQPVPLAAAVPARPKAPSPTTSNDPTARIASLSALVTGRETARAAEQGRRDLAVRRLAETHLAENAALARADLLGRAAITAQADYRAARAQVAELAGAYYRNAGSPTVLLRLLQSRSAAEYGYRQKIVSVVGDHQTQIVKRARRAREAAARAARDAGHETQRLHALVATFEEEIPSRNARIDDLQVGVSRARYWLARWESIVGGVNTPIMSRSILGPNELAEWFVATRHRGARITVSMDELARDFIEEGQAAQVRGDIAFAQSILETASFYFPDGGQLTPTDNNFAGINACDSCPTGSAFPDARIGVRAQMQLLRVYADANLTNAQLNPPAVDPRLDQHFLKGQVPTWNGLTHTWATANAYGDRILEIYEQILGWLTDRAEI